MLIDKNFRTVIVNANLQCCNFLVFFSEKHYRESHKKQEAYQDFLMHVYWVLLTIKRINIIKVQCDIKSVYEKVS